MPPTVAPPLTDADFRQFLERTPEAVLLQRGGVITYVNAAFLRATGAAEPARFVGQALTSIVAAEDREAVAARLREGGAGAAWAPWDVRAVAADGSVLVLECSVIRVGASEPWTSIIVCRDVTEQRAQAEALRRAESELRLVFESAPIGIALADLQGRYVRANAAMCQLVGYREEELKQLTFTELTHPDDRGPDARAAAQLNQRESGRVQRRKRYLHKSGRAVHVAVDISVARGLDGEPVGYISHIADASAERVAAEALRLAEEQFRSIFANAPIGMGLTSLGADTGRFKRVNAALCTLLEYSEEELLRLPFAALTEPADFALDEKLSLEEIGQGHTSIRRYRAKSGRVIETERFISLIDNSAGLPEAAVVQIVDISARRAAERSLRESEALHRTLLRNLPNVSVMLYDRQLRYTMAEGHRILESFGFDPKKVVGMTVRQLAHPSAAARLEAHFRRALEGEVVRWEHIRDGRSFDAYASPVRDEDGAVVGGVYLAYETTEHRRLQAQLADSEDRLSSLIENAADAMWSVDREGRFTAFNSRFVADMQRTYGVSIALGGSMFDFLPEPAQQQARENHRRCLAGETVQVEWSSTLEGKPIHMLLTHNPIRSHDAIAGASMMAKDITHRREMELAGQRQARIVALLQAIASAANEATNSDAAIARSLALVAEFAGWSAGHAFELIEGTLVSRRTWYLRDPSAMERFRAQSEEIRFVRGEGMPGRVLASKRPAWMTSLHENANFLRAEVAGEHGLKSGFAFPVLVGDEVATVIEFFSERDEEPSDEIVQLMSTVGIQLGRVIERERHAAQVSALSLTDELTGLNNRRGFMTLAGQQLRALVRSRRAGTVLFADLDGLKRINDELGHEAGDEAISTFAQVLRKTFRDGDILSRFGGDEFVVFLDGPLPEANAAVERLRDNLLRENVERPPRAALHASVGVVEATGDSGVTLEEIVARADAEMYQDKRVRRAARLATPRDPAALN